MTDLERVLREGLHDRLDDLGADALGDVGRGVPQRAARIRRRQSAVLAGLTSLILLAGVTAAAYLPGGGDESSVSVTQDGATLPERPDLVGRAERYAELLVAGDYAAIRADMTDPARQVLTEDRLRTVGRTAFGDEPAVVVSAAREFRTGNRRVARVIVRRLSRPGAEFYVVFSDDLRVSGLLLLEPGVGAKTWEPVVLKAREVVGQLQRGSFAQVRRDFDPTMLKALSAEQLEVVWQQVQSTYGSFESARGHLVTVAPTGHRVVDVVAQFKYGLMKVRVAFDSQQRIAGLFVLVLDA